MHQDVFRPRLLVVALLLTIGFAALVRQLYWIQIERHGELLEKAKEKYTTSATVHGERGLIFDVHGNLLAGNLACYDVFAEPRQFKDRIPFLLNYLSRRLDVPRRALGEKFAFALRPGKPLTEVVLFRGLEIKQGKDIESDLNRLGIRGIRFVDSDRRYCPKNSLLANLVGFVDGEGSGVAGIEKMQDARLQPTAETNVFERDRRGVPLPLGNGIERKPHNGANVYLTIDEAVQQIVESELKVMVDAFLPRAAYAVMVNPKTGAILAMAQYPTFNPNKHPRPNPDCWRNRILTEGFEPGSIMKAVPITAALDEGIVTLDTTMNCENGSWFYSGRSLRDSGHRYGTLAVRNIVQKSSNIGTAKIALMMGQQRVYDTIQRFGFGQVTGIGLAGEAPGIFRSLKKWDGLSLTRFPIGQGILVTPLQMVQAYSALANRGLMYQLTVIDRIENPESGICEVNRPRLKCRVAGEKAILDITSALKLVTLEGGTALRAAVPGYEVAGKTGTAQKAGIGGYSHSQYVSSFIGFVPADDAAFVLLVTADEPSKGGYYGGTVAAPTFSRIAEKTLRYMQVAPAKAGTAPMTPAPEIMPNEDMPPTLTSIP